MALSEVRDIFQVQEIEPHRNFKTTDPNLYDVDLSFAGVDSQYSMHSLHPYVAAINPPLANALIQTYVPRNETVLDPFCGGGGVLLESTLLGRQNAGGDINPLSIILSKAKTTYVEPSTISKAYKEIIEAVRFNNFDLTLDPKINFWFKEESIPVINSISQAIYNVTAGEGKLQTLFQAIFSATVRDVMLTYRGEVRLRRLREEDFNKFKPDVLKSFEKRSNIALERMGTLPTNCESNIDIRDIKKMEFSDGEFHSIVCSPPYADDKNGVGYFQFSKNMLACLGWTSESINSYKKLFLGSQKDVIEVPQSESLSISLANVKARSDVHFKEAVSFYSDYNTAIGEMARVVRQSIIIVIGNRVLSRTQFDNAQITVDFMNNLGIPLKHHYTRDLRKKRIANLGGDGGGIAKEHILVFEKR